jgi:hypothetical protein
VPKKSQADEEMQSRPIDADQLAARLLDMSADEDAISQRSRPSGFERSPTVEGPNEEAAKAKKLEAAAYANLVSDGGQPP